MSATTWTECQWTDGRPRVRAVRRVAAADRVPAVRLTRRGRAAAVLLTVLAVLVAAVVLAGLGAPATATGDPGAVAVADRVTVRPGETLWEIAERARPRTDPRETIARIRDMNGLTSSVAQAGQVLLVPAGARP